LHCARPIIRAGDDVEPGRDRRIAYLPEFYFQADERELLPGDLIEPVERGSAPIGESFGDPDDRHRFQSRGVCKQLAEMQVVSALKLVFDQDPRIVGSGLAQLIGAKRPELGLLRLQLKLNTHGLAEQFKVLFERQPGGKIAGFVAPYLPQVHACQSSECLIDHIHI
jgi:hypothetical protein